MDQVHIYVYSLDIYAMRLVCFDVVLSCAVVCCRYV